MVIIIKYLHFMPDHFYTTKFIDIIQSKFNPQEHSFVIIRKKDKRNYINPYNYQNVKIFTVSREQNVLKFIMFQIRFFTRDSIRIRKIMKQAEYIFIHNLTEEISGLLFTFKGIAKKLWVMWGTDLYDYLPINLFDNYTSKLVNKLDSKLLLMLIRFYYSFFYAVRKKVIKRLDYVISAHQGDIRFFKKYFKTKAECLFQNIYPNPLDFERIENSDIFENKFLNFKDSGVKLLLLGNSGGPTNNHIDLMIRLSNMREQNFKIICPLSYGPSSYIKKIVEKGKELFGDRFIPLLDFLKPELYYQILKQIDLAIMYHNRQQGIGNIQVLLFLGKAVCMKKTSIFYQLLDRGAFIFSIQDLEKLILTESEFKEDYARKNKKIALKYFSVESARSSIEYILNHLEERDSKIKFL